MLSTMSSDPMNNHDSTVEHVTSIWIVSKAASEEATYDKNMKLYYASHMKDERVLLGPRNVIVMMEELRRKLPQAPMTEVTKEDAWMRIAEVLQDLGMRKTLVGRMLSC